MVQRRGTSAGRAWRWDTRPRLRGAGGRGGPGGSTSCPPPASRLLSRIPAHSFRRTAQITLLSTNVLGSPRYAGPLPTFLFLHRGPSTAGGARASAGRPGSFSADAEPRLLRGPAWEAGAQLWGLREHSPGGDRAPRGQEPLRPSSMTQRHAPPPSESDNAHFPPKRPLLGMVQKKVPCGQITSPPIGQTFQRPRPHGDELTAPPRPPLSRPCGVLSTLIFQKHACFHGAKTT